MAMSKGGIDKAEDVPAVESTTEETPHPADEDSSPGPYKDLSPDRPPVSTTQPDVPIAQSLVGGAGAPHEEGQVTPADDHDAAEAPAAAKPASSGPAKRDS